VLPSPDLQWRSDEEKYEEVKYLVKLCNEEYFPAFGKILMAPAPPIQAEFRPKLIEAIKKVNAALNKSKGNLSHTQHYFYCCVVVVVKVLIYWGRSILLPI